VDEQRTPNSTVSLGHALDEWLRTAELDDTTRKSYSG
jgi:integrase